MAVHTAPLVTALQAQATANLFLSACLPDRFTADQPRLVEAERTWQVPILLVYPGVNAVGCVGDVHVSTAEEKVIWHTPLAEMKQRAQQLYDTHRDAIEAAFS